MLIPRPNSQHNWGDYMTIYWAQQSLLWQCIRYSYELRKLWGKLLALQFRFANHLMLVTCFMIRRCNRDVNPKSVYIWSMNSHTIYSINWFSLNLWGVLLGISLPLPELLSFIMCCNNVDSIKHFSLFKSTCVGKWQWDLNCPFELCRGTCCSLIYCPMAWRKMLVYRHIFGRYANAVCID